MQLLRIDEVANDYFRVSKTKVYRMIQSGDLQRVHLDGCARVTKKSVIDYLRRQGVEIED